MLNKLRLMPVRVGLVALVVLFTMSYTAIAQQSIERLLRDGLELLSAKRYTLAFEKFKAATTIRRDASNAWLLRGVAENRLSRYGDAFTSLQLAKTLGVKVSRLDFEIGWSAVNLLLFDTAIEHLERYEKAKPGAAKTAEFLARALTGVGRFDDAEAKFREALRRDPGIKPTVLYGLARLERARGND